MEIMAAAEEGRGLNLTREECLELSMDDAIATRAAVFLDCDDDFSTQENFTWVAAIKRWKKRWLA